MVDKVKPLKIEDTSSGTELNLHPTETDPSEDYISTKGISFENSDDYLAEKIGRVLKFTTPNHSEAITYTGTKVTSVEVFNGFTQTTPNRISRTDFTYTGNNLTQEELKIYDPSDGTTVLRTITYDYTYTGTKLTNTEVTEV